MGYLILWLVSLASALLLVATVYSCSARLKKWRIVWPILAMLFLVSLGAFPIFFSGFLFFNNINPQWLFPYTLIWTFNFMIGTWFLLRRGKSKSGETIVAATWSRRKLTTVFVLSLFSFWITLEVMDNSAKLRAAAIQAASLSKARAILPSPPSSNQDAGPLYESVKESFKKPPKWFGEARDNPAFDPKADKVKKFILDKKNSMDVIREATNRPYLYQPIVLSYEFLFPDLYSLINSTDIFAMEARLKALNGNSAVSFKNISYMKNIAAHINQTPLLINTLIAGNIYKKSSQTIESVLADFPEGTKLKIDLPVKNSNTLIKTFKKSMLVEPLIMISGLSENLLGDENLFGGTDHTDPPLIKKLYRVFLYPDDLAFHNMYWKNFHELLHKPYHETGLELKNWENNFYKDHNFGFLSSIAMSDYLGYVERVNETQTKILLANLGLAAAAYKSDHQKYPSSINELAPKYITDIPTDPFDGKPLRMLKVDGGLIFYSTGKDGKDDGGVEKSDDLTFCLGSAFTERRLKPAIEKMRKEKKKKN